MSIDAKIANCQRSIHITQIHNNLNGKTGIYLDKTQDLLSLAKNRKGIYEKDLNELIAYSNSNDFEFNQNAAEAVILLEAMYN